MSEDIKEIEEIIKETTQKAERDARTGKIREIEEIIEINNKRISGVLDRAERIATEDEDRGEKLLREMKRAEEIEHKVRMLEDEMARLQAERWEIMRETYNNIKRII